MSKVQLAREILTFMGGSKAEVKTLAKGLGNEIGQILRGQPRGVKKQFLKSAKQLTKNPYNEQAEKNVKSVISRSKDVVNYATLPSGEVIEPFRNIRAIETYQALIGPMQRKQSIGNIMNGVEQRLNEISVDLTPTVVELSPKQISQIQKELFKDIRYTLIKEPWVQMKSDARKVVDFIKGGVVSLFTPKSLKNVLKDTVKLPNEKFGETFYKKLVANKGISDRAPKGFTVTNESAPVFSEGMGGFNPFKNTIEYTKGFTDKAKSKQAGLIAHELLHWEQTDVMIRTFGIERYIQAMQKRSINILKAEKEYANKTDKELLDIANKALKERNITPESIKKAFKTSTDAPKIDPNSKLGQQAIKYIEATENYQPPKIKDLGLGIKIIDSTEGYTTNLLEKEAYKEQSKTQIFAKAFENLRAAFS